MSFNKNLLAAAVVGLLASANAGAVVLGVDDARVYAQELIKPVLITDPAATIDAELGYNFSDLEVRYGRLECQGDVELTPSAAPAVAAGGSGDISLGAVNGAGTNAIHFSITDDGANALATAGDVLQYSFDVELNSNDDVDCAFSIYDQPSQAQAGGTAGLIYTTGFAPFIASEPSFAFTADPGTATADVEAANGAFTAFIGAAGGTFGELTFDLIDYSGSAALLEDGTPVTMADLFDTTTTITVEGDYSAADDLDLATYGVADDITGDVATFESGAQAFVDAGLTYIENGDDAILASDYTATLNAVIADDTRFEFDGVGPIEAGEIVRNGTQLQAPLVQVPNGWLSRMVLTNTGSIARAYTIEVFGETGNTITTGTALTGTVPANGTQVVDLRGNVLSAFTGQARATLNVNVAGPNNQIQGLYQIVNPASGSISNHVMVRPGTN